MSLSLHRHRAFSLIELLVVLAIICLLSALLYPVFLTVQGSARQTVCVSNLRQIGQGIALYQQDYDGYFPRAVSPLSHAYPEMWAAPFPAFAAEVPHIPGLPDILRPYVASPQLFACPADTGFSFTDYPSFVLDAASSSYHKFGTSYFYRDIYTACGTREAQVRAPAERALLYDPVGFWHGTLTPIQPRYTVLFADGHVKSQGREHFESACGVFFGPESSTTQLCQQ